MFPVQNFRFDLWRPLTLSEKYSAKKDQLSELEESDETEAPHKPSASPVFLRLGSTKGCQGFRETEMRNGGRLLLEVQNFYVRIKIHLTIFDINDSVTRDNCTWNFL
jgi:hypothetical protein